MKQTKFSVLIIEDDLLQRTVLSELCENLGYKAICLENGEAALAYLPYLSERHFVITDMELGKGMTGIDIGKLVKKACKNIFLVGMSSNSNYQTIVLKAGFNLFLTKPITIKQLKEVLNHQNFQRFEKRK